MARRVQVTFDCADPGALAGFWASVLDYVEPAPPGGHADWPSFLRSIGMAEEDMDAASAVEDPEGIGPRLYFQKVPEGKTAKNRVHLDVALPLRRDQPREEQWEALRSEAKRLIELGAVVVREVDEPRGRCIVLQDPEGNEFCLH